MSWRALQLACLDQLRATAQNGGLNYDRNNSDVNETGEPNAFQGKKVVIIHPAGARNTQRGSLEEYHAVDITITLRINEPLDRVGTDLLNKLKSGLHDIASDLKSMMTQQQYTIMNAANVYLGASVNGFIEPLSFLSASVPEKVGADWFKGDDASECGLKMTLHFGDAMRLQDIAQAG